MASRIQAINTFRPRVDQGNTVQKGEYTRVLARNSTANEGTVDSILKETRDLIIQYCREGRAIKIEGIGVFTPTVGLDGTFDVSVRPDNALAEGLNTAKTFTGSIINSENIGKTADELVALWNTAHPEDPVTEP
ncbi:MAG: hypothetical protein JNM55_13895 [Anaerolineales bacterium]|nr:hypothetical protein [Anaerolineales bacterium]